MRDGCQAPPFSPFGEGVYDPYLAVVIVLVFGRRAAARRRAGLLLSLSLGLGALLGGA